MEPVTMVATAFAIGASEGARETTKKAINDAYTALRNWIASKYNGVSAEVDGLAQEPDEELRRALLAKKLAGLGAGGDVELHQLAQALLSAVQKQEPDLAATVGVALRRASVGGDIEVVNVSVDGGSGVIAEDITAEGSVRIGGVSARGPQEPPHPSSGAGVVDDLSAPAQSFTSSQRNVNAGRDVITNVNYAAPTEAGNSGGRIRAVTVSIEAVPIGRNLWAVKVNNGTSGPITDLQVDVYAVEDDARRTPERCRPAKGNISLRQLMHDALSESLGGGLDVIGQQAQSMNSGLPPGFGLGGQMSQLRQLGGYGSMLSGHLMKTPQMSQVIQQLQQQMLDEFPRVVPAGQAAGVLYVVDGDAELRTDIQFADEVGALWRRPFGESPEPVLEEK